MAKKEFVIRGCFPDSATVMDLLVRDGVVAAVGPAGRRRPDIGDKTHIIAPPLFDIQVNGAFGIDLQAPGFTVESVYALNNAFIRRGVQRWIPTLITDAVDALEHKCRTLAKALEDPALARHIPGVHLEGPYILPVDGPRGAHPRAHVIPPSVAVFNRLFRAASGRIACITLAPELPGACRLIRAARRRGVVVALGHHAADAGHIDAAVRAGAQLSTHLGNGMATRIHRHRNELWPQLADDRLYASLIADLEHVPPHPLRVFARVKGPERTILTSDCVFLAGMKPGRYRMSGATVDLKRNGRVCLAGTELLAGSSLMLLDGVWNMSRNSDFTLGQAFAAASLTPARLFNVPLVASWPPRPGDTASFLLVRVASESKRKGALRLCAWANHGDVHIEDT